MKMWVNIVTLALSSNVLAADWPMFRGGDRSGVSAETDVPVEWSKGKNVKWRVELPGPGNSSPIVSNGKVFVTCAEDRQGIGRSLYCFDRKSGEKVWVKTVAYEKKDPTHETNPHAASTPAANGERIVVWHGPAGVYCYDFEGKEIWSRKDISEFRHIWGYASSPVIHGGMVYLNHGPGVATYVTALDLNSGKTVWKMDVPGGAEDKSEATKTWIGSWSTPLVANIGGREQLVVHLPGQVQGFDLASGKLLWSRGGVSDLAYTDPLISGDVMVAMAGFTGPAIGFKLPAAGEKEPPLLWRVEKNPQRIGSGVVVNGYIFMPSETGIQCIEARTGKELWRHRPEGHSFWSPATATKERIYLTSQKGATFVIAPNAEKYTQLAANELGEQTNSAIAISDGQVFVRTFEALYCIDE
jgi:outer membrane protein assembly factor BamB